MTSMWEVTARVLGEDVNTARRWARAWKAKAKHYRDEMESEEAAGFMLAERIAELEDAAKELLDSMFRRAEPGLTLPPTNSSVDKLRELLEKP